MSRDTSVVRRGLAAGAITWALASALLAALGGWRLAPAAVLVALVPASIVASGWLLLAAALDLLAGERPGRRRLWWTAAVVLFTVASPACLAGAQAR